MKGPRGNHLSCQPMYRQLKRAVNKAASLLGDQELSSLESNLKDNPEDRVDVEWGIYAKVKTKSGCIKFETVSKTKVKDKCNVIKLNMMKEFEKKMVNIKNQMKLKDKELYSDKDEDEVEAEIVSIKAAATSCSYDNTYE